MSGEVLPQPHMKHTLSIYGNAPPKIKITPTAQGNVVEEPGCLCPYNKTVDSDLNRFIDSNVGSGYNSFFESVKALVRNHRWRKQTAPTDVLSIEQEQTRSPDGAQIFSGPFPFPLREESSGAQQQQLHEQQALAVAMSTSQSAMFASQGVLAARKQPEQSDAVQATEGEGKPEEEKKEAEDSAYYAHVGECILVFFAFEILSNIQTFLLTILTILALFLARY